jgi:hypothetical protein
LGKSLLVVLLCALHKALLILHLTTPCQLNLSLALFLLWVQLATGVPMCINYNEENRKKIGLETPIILLELLLPFKPCSPIIFARQHKKYQSKHNKACHIGLFSYYYLPIK